MRRQTMPYAKCRLPRSIVIYRVPPRAASAPSHISYTLHSAVQNARFYPYVPIFWGTPQDKLPQKAPAFRFDQAQKQPSLRSPWHNKILPRRFRLRGKCRTFSPCKTATAAG